MTDELIDSEHPPFLYGTAWKEDRTTELTKLAIRAGFRGIDTANQRKHYYEKGVGDAVKAAIDDELVTRDELFLQTKFTYVAGQDERLPYDPDSSFTEQVEQSFASSLEHLQTDYIDSYILHGPSTHSGLSDADHEVWTAMEELVLNELVDVIGVSNVSANQLQLLLDSAEIPPTFVQNRCFARTGWDFEVRRICAANNIVYQGFSLLTANSQQLQRREIKDIAARYERTIPQIVFRFAIQVGMLPLTGTTNEEHMRQDLQVFDFELDAGDVDAIEQIAVE